MTTTPLLSLQHVHKRFTGVAALTDITLNVHPGQVTCLLGDNGAGKSTLIKVLSGVHEPTEGTIELNGEVVTFASPRDARAAGIATVHQDVGSIPLMSVARNFFLGAEPMKGRGPLKRIDKAKAASIALAELHDLGIRRVKSGDQLVGTLSGGERQALAICRAMYFGAKVLILDEPTSALGVKEASKVLQLIQLARQRGVGVVFITHNATHAMHVGDHFTVLIQGKVAADFAAGERTREELLNLMAGGEEMESLHLDVEEHDDLAGLQTAPSSSTQAR